MPSRPHKEPISRNEFFLGDSLVQPQLNRISRADATIQIEPKIMHVLVLLAERPSQVVTREQLMDSVWGDVNVSEQVLSRSISELRKILSDDSKTQSIIETIPKTGYRLIAPVSHRANGNPEATTPPLSGLALAPGSPATRAHSSWRTIGLIGTLFLCAVLVGFVARGWTWSDSTSSPPVMRLALDLAETIPPEIDMFQSFALSPDGARIVYVAKTDGKYRLLQRALDHTESIPIPGSEGGAGPFFSPDGQSVGFYAGGVLKKAPITGGAPVVIGGPAEDAVGASWGQDGAIVFSRRLSDGLYRIPESGGKAEPLTTVDFEEGERSHFWPTLLPGGKAVIFTVWPSTGLGDARIDAVVLATGERRTLIAGGSQAYYLPTGHLVYASKGTLRVVPFDVTRLEVTGPEAPMPERVSTSLITGAAHYACSSSGVLVYLPKHARRADLNILWVDRNGQSRPLLEQRRTYWTPRLSPEGKRLAVAIQNESFDLWLFDVVSGALKRLTFEKGNFAPVWTPDGRRIVFSSDVGGAPLNLYWKAADGSDNPERLTQSANLQFPGSWSPDGGLLAYSEIDPQSRWDIWILSFEAGRRSVRPLINTSSNETQPAFSPDGRWLAYTSDETRQQHVYVQSFPPGGGKWQISTDGGAEPAWRRDGNELFFRSGDRVMSVRIDTRNGFKASNPEPLFEGKFKLESATLLPSFDVARDGRLFVMMKSEEETSPTRLSIVLGWLEDLKHRVVSEPR